MFVCPQPYTENFNLTNGNKGISTLHTCSSNSNFMQVDTMDPSLSNSMPMDLLSVTEDSSPCNPTPMDLLSAKERLRLEREERATARLQRRHQRDQERRRSAEIEVRQARLDRQHVCKHDRRAAEQSAASQARLDTDRQRTHERRATEQPTARQATHHLLTCCKPR